VCGDKMDAVEMTCERLPLVGMPTVSAAAGPERNGGSMQYAKLSSDQRLSGEQLSSDVVRGINRMIKGWRASRRTGSE
jgi:hypothetical protein